MAASISVRQAGSERSAALSCRRRIRRCARGDAARRRRRRSLSVHWAAALVPVVVGAVYINVGRHDESWQLMSNYCQTVRPPWECTINARSSSFPFHRLDRPCGPSPSSSSKEFRTSLLRPSGIFHSLVLCTQPSPRLHKTSRHSIHRSEEMRAKQIWDFVPLPAKAKLLVCSLESECSPKAAKMI